MGCYYSRINRVDLDTAAATNRDVDSKENRDKFVWAEEAMTYDNLLLDRRISHADVRDYGRVRDLLRCGNGGMSGLHYIPWNHSKGIDTDMLLSYLLTCDPPADVNGRSRSGFIPMWDAAYCNNTSAVKVLIDFGGDRTIKSSNAGSYPNTTPLDIAKVRNYQETIELLTECFPSEE